jgi:hypothetical protein
MSFEAGFVTLLQTFVPVAELVLVVFVFEIA